MAEFPIDDIEVRLVHRDQLTVESSVPSDLSGFVNFFLNEAKIENFQLLIKASHSLLSLIQFQLQFPI